MVTVAGLSGSSKVAVTVVLIDTPLAPSSGLVAVTAGGVTSGGTAVVKLQLTSLPMVLPARSARAAPAVTV